MSEKIPNRDEWMKLLDELSMDLAAMEIKISQIKDYELPDMEVATQKMRERLLLLLLAIAEK